MKRPAATTHEKPVLDEASFQQLLSAAFVLQQHNERLQNGTGPDNGSSSSRALSAIVEIQEQVRSRQLDLRAASVLVALQVREITGATGSAVSFVEEPNHLDYYAATGTAVSQAGKRVPIGSSLAEDCLLQGEVLQCPQAEMDPLVRPDLCRELRVKSFVAAPIFYQGRTCGALELHFNQPNSFQEQDVRSCQLLAALLAEVLAKRAQGEETTHRSIEPVNSGRKLSEPPPFVDRASMLAALEKITPQLERLVTASAGSTIPSEVYEDHVLHPSVSTDETVACSGCGHALAKDELFCGLCGSARPEDVSVVHDNPPHPPEHNEASIEPGPNTWASLWEMQRAAEKAKSGNGTSEHSNGSGHEHDPLEILPSEMEEVVARLAREHGEIDSRTPPEISPRSNEPARTTLFAAPAALDAPEATAATTPLLPDFSRETESIFPSFGSENYPHDEHTQPPSEGLVLADAHGPARAAEHSPSTALESAPPWNSAALTPDSREAQSGGSWFAKNWQAQRANIYLGASVLLLIAVLAGWGTPSAPSATPAQHHKTAAPSPESELTPFEKLLVELGVAEAPEAPPDPGNPDAHVWVDVHTALYYCSGSDLYGKTAGGRFTSQRDAEEDHFASASRKACP